MDDRFNLDPRLPPIDAPPIGIPPRLTAEEFEAEVDRVVTEAERDADRTAAPASAAREATPPSVTLVSAASLASKYPAPRHFLAPGLIPGRDVTLLTGHGGDGKSLLALMLLAAVGSHLPWLGVEVAHGRALYLSAEDELDEVHRRLAAICSAEGLDLADLDRLDILPLAGEPALLAIEGKGGAMTPTPLWAAFAAKVEAIRPALAVIDNAADVFGGNEISRAHVRQFISMLRGLALKADCAILLLSHPSVAGMSTGTGLSGSTAWNNSVRSRLYLTRPEAAQGEITDPDARILQAKKSNYGPLAADIQLRWADGRFVNESTAPPTRLDKATVEAKAEAVFLDLLQQFESEGRSVSPNSGHSYAPAIFSAHADAKGVSKSILKAAMDRLLKAGRIKVETTGPVSRRISRLEFVVENRGGE
jgi:RecA-family ATPase